MNERVVTAGSPACGRPMFRAGSGWYSAETPTPTAELCDPIRLERYEGFLQGLLDVGEVEMAGVRLRAVEFYGFGQ